MQAASDQRVLKLQSGVWMAGVWWDIPQAVLNKSHTTPREKAGLRRSMLGSCWTQARLYKAGLAGNS
eukprot:11442008-Prorocentrum_lima.AAC.1